MVEKKLVNYINSGLESGKSADQIRGELLKHGWPEKDVDEALGTFQEGGKVKEKPAVGKTPEKPQKKGKFEVHEKHHKYLYIIGLVVIVSIIAGTTYYLTIWGAQEMMEAEQEGECGNGVCNVGEDYASCPLDCPQPVPPAGPQKVSVSPATQTVNVGSTVFVEIEISDANDLYGYQFNIEYDPNILQYESIEEGSFLNKNGADSTFPVDPKISADLIKNIARTRMGPVGGLKGDGTLETITFTALSAGTSEIKISNIKFVSSKTEMIETTGENGQVVVS
jgi:hypothetical protein